ncbi:hypothetical protein [Amycolatopsis rifamycinica]|uniref:Uncharacterized protein n=1 Tax=Amycolatopsis rifamycinica TaxID=287986 RepID=A0A066U7K0_9PSEU|nr:hypothetical protein [Amycolatopsis rifamycinica]KDN21837.1 hypothetical protein DV20_12970 [Amycolatopsis rifamycinica]
MKKSLFALAMLPAAGALAVLGAGTASATTTTSAASPIQVMASCDPIWMLSDRAGGNCYDIAFRVGVRCKSTRGDWQVFFSDWHQPRNPATAFCPAGWETVSADYDLPE